MVSTKRLVLLMLILFTAFGCNARRGVTRYNTSKQMHKHSTLQNIPRAKASKEKPYRRKGPRDKVMNKSK